MLFAPLPVADSRVREAQDLDRKKRKKSKIHRWHYEDGARKTRCGLVAGSGVRLAIGGFDGDTANCAACLSYVDGGV